MLNVQAAVTTDELLLLATDDEGCEDDTLLRDEEIEELELDSGAMLDDELVALPQAIPVTAGNSAEADPFEPWKPNSMY